MIDTWLAIGVIIAIGTLYNLIGFIRVAKKPKRQGNYIDSARISHEYMKQTYDSYPEYKPGVKMICWWDNNHVKGIFIGFRHKYKSGTHSVVWVWKPDYDKDMSHTETTCWNGCYELDPNKHIFSII